MAVHGSGAPNWQSICFYDLLCQCQPSQRAPRPTAWAAVDHLWVPCAGALGTCSIRNSSAEPGPEHLANKSAAPYRLMSSPALDVLPVGSWANESTQRLRAIGTTTGTYPRPMVQGEARGVGVGWGVTTPGWWPKRTAKTVPPRLIGISPLTVPVVTSLWVLPGDRGW